MAVILNSAYTAISWNQMILILYLTKKYVEASIIKFKLNLEKIQ